MLGGLLKWSRECVSYKSAAVEGISVVETTNAMVGLRECQQREEIRGHEHRNQQGQRRECCVVHGGVGSGTLPSPNGAPKLLSN